jgi:bacterioferritin-associated ferredoxin
VVWSVTGEYRIDAVGPDGPMHCMARALIVASGATVRMVPFEGWTLPGVFDLGTAAKRLTSQESLPGRSTLVVGCGPWLAAVAAKTIEAGGRVEAIVDLAGAAESVHARPRKDDRPDLRLQRVNWWRTIRRAGTRRYGRWTIVRAESAGAGLRATLARCDAGGRAIDTPRTTVLADCIVVGHGFIPATEITALLRARHTYSRAAGGWIAATDDDGRTSRALLYCAGDAAGIAGADAAVSHGTLVGLACAADLAGAGSSQLQRRIHAARREHGRSASLARATAKLMALRSAQVDAISPETIVCRCEDVSRADIDAACAAGAQDMNQLKAWTRCGMGLCQGRLCGDIAAELLMQRLGAGSREHVGWFTARTPLRPVTLDVLIGDFKYEDIAIPTAAPL